MKRIGFIGLGSIGAPMARCLLRAGFGVTACDNRGEALEPFRAAGACVTSRPADCAVDEFVVVMVADDAQVQEVVLGDGGLLSGVALDQPPLLAVMSTVLPQTIHSLVSPCHSHNVHLLDAPVSGLPVLAEQGKLTIMVGGEATDLERARPAFRAMGENIFHTGPLGTGEIVKLLNNMLGLPGLFLTMEAMQVAHKLGMDPGRLAAILEVSSGRNFLTHDWARSRAIFDLFSRTPEIADVAINLSRKDLEHAHALAESVGVACPVLERVRDTVEAITSQEFMTRLRSLV